MENGYEEVLVEEKAKLNIPGANLKAYCMLPFRIFFFLVFFCLFYPILLVVSVLRAIFLRIVKGKPSQVLATGSYEPGRTHVAGMHYPCYLLHNAPLDEDALQAAVASVCEEDGIAEDEFEVKFEDEEPIGWPDETVFNLSEILPEKFVYPYNHLDYWLFGVPIEKYHVRLHVHNGKEGNPTVVLFAGSAFRWDGSSNYNFYKEVMNRYMGNPPNEVFRQTECKITAAAAKKADSVWFLWFLLKQPYHLAVGLGGWIWHFLRASTCSGGNGIGPKIVALNLTREESDALYKGSKAVGASPYAVFSYAAYKATKEILNDPFVRIVNQASLQRDHFPLPDQDESRDLVGDWLIGPTSIVPKDFTLAKAQGLYEEMIKDMKEFGPMTQRSFAAKAWGVVNTGAANFEVMPMYNDEAYLMGGRTLFMNQYGVRTNPNPSFDAWNWQAPMWLGINTISVNGKTTTMVGSAIWGQEVVEALAASMEATIREIIAESV